MRIHISLLLAGLVACSGPDSETAPAADVKSDSASATDSPMGEATGDLAALRANVAETMARP